LSENRKEILDAIMRAMEIEKETFDYYTRAEQKTFDPSGKRIFRWLAKTEEEHYLKLSELYNALEESGHWVFYGGSTISLDAEGPDEKEIGFTTGDLEALEIAMEIEKKGIAYFDELTRKITDPNGRKMLAKLREEEGEHLRVITEKYNQLRVKSEGLDPH
jgi:rubrerythrin